MPRSLARLNADYSLDAGFNADANYFVSCLLAQADGKILVGGSFTNLNGVARNGLGRLNPDGSLDMDFNPNVNGMVRSLAMQLDGATLLGGTFSSVRNTTRSNFARLMVTGEINENWSYDGANLTWHRGGPSAEVQDLTLESSADGLVWEPFALGTRADDLWSVDAITLPFQQQHVRARTMEGSSGVTFPRPEHCSRARR